MRRIIVNLTYSDDSIESAYVGGYGYQADDKIRDVNAWGKVMKKKETVTQDDLMKVLDLMDNTGIHYWLDGGWGVDVLAGAQTREHRDVDIDFDSRYTEKLLQILKNSGFEIVTDWSPVRIELYHPQLSYIDIHPFVLNNDGSAKQADLEGGWYEFGADFFGNVVFNERNVPCISAKAQKIFHTGYELREVDKHDIKIIEKLLDLQTSMRKEEVYDRTIER